MKRKAEKDEDCVNPKESKIAIDISIINITQQFLNIANHLNIKLDELHSIKDIEYVYNPTRYAYSNYRSYVEKYCNTTKNVMFLGMNPGPWGMSQTGIPFGEVDTVKNWLKIEETILKPEKELPSRPVLGYACKRSEVSGKRFWGLMKELCGVPEIFFKHCFVYNYLPLQFINASGKNLPPTVLKPKQQQDIYKVCDKSLIDVIDLYEVKTIVAIGKFCESRVKFALSDESSKDNLKIVSILHPSPQSKAANNWQIDARRQLEELGLLEYLLKK